MIYLLDTNVLIALCDPNHTQHQAAHTWFSKSRRNWATCPITENGFVRITSHTAYPGRVGDASFSLSLLQEFCKAPGHSFIADDATLLDIDLKSALLQSAHVTDLYLLSLATKHGARLTTFDRRIPSHLIGGGEKGLEWIG